MIEDAPQLQPHPACAIQVGRVAKRGGWKYSRLDKCIEPLGPVNLDMSNIFLRKPNVEILVGVLRHACCWQHARHKTMAKMCDFHCRAIQFQSDSESSGIICVSDSS